MNTTLQTIDRLKQTLSELQPMKPEYRQQLDKKIRLEFNYNSNHIEGNTLTYDETQLLLIFDKTTGNHELREYEEMKSHDIAYELIKEWALDTERPLTEMTIKNLHEVLLVRPFWKEALTADGQSTRRLIKVGNYKEQPNSVRLQNGEMFHYTSPEETPIQMGQLIQWYREEEEKGELHPVALGALLHYKFVRIHPFDDGNGRLSRLLMNYALLKHNLPPVVIKSTDKKNYLFALNQADAGDLNAFVEYIGSQIIWSLELSIKAYNGEQIEEEDDWAKKLRLLKKQQAINEKVIPRSVETVLDIIHNSAFTLIEKIIKKLSDFDDLFAEKRLLFGNNSMSHLIIKPEQIIKLLAEQNDKYMNDIKFDYELNGYNRDGINTFSVGIYLKWQFEQFKYFFFFDNNDSSKAQVKLYNQNFTPDEINLLANECGKKIMHKMEEQLSTNK